jgi:hypothetical protein
MTSTSDTPDPDANQNRNATDLHRADDRTGLLLVDDGVVVYDVENPEGWLQSDVSVALAERR